ncbi:FAD/FMN-containing isoamyl alcohol oxidase MreA [Hypoxylon trugodes]|uniref:FAD/FMN-containing isoamyl alcohol oxidase MreA n=1 Tax=Hypoxylon trugodes TaxID=326681 RepID=UPI0021A20FF1|nr:FAD/FMN-containing isoamyl alcohol oxidase MreA [Hypoxylon trugodes]KAI1389103.1 FAD/FMN-containing isoamyl alcohol oxidase MreA [Hypoxylon trugodes]
MTLESIVLCLLANLVLTASAEGISTPSGCRTIPGDISWPTSEQWDLLNRTVNGNLIATIPIAAPCHETLFGEPSPIFNQAECDALLNTWFYPTTHLPSSSSPMAYMFSNNSCNPFLGPETPCTIGYLVVYAINATSVEDIQAGLQFAKENNIRLVIRNTGHDYLGKSTGAHALGIWTHNLKSMELIQDFKDENYTGPAVKISAGVRVVEAYEFADSHNLIVVGGNCPTVGFAGGYIQGGGHGPLSSRFGLAADQVLEYEVVTSDGKLITASDNNNSDLFWALRGGGGSTYGIVISVTVKAFQDTSFSMSYLQIPNNGTNTDQLYSVIGTFIETLPKLVDAGVVAIFVVSATGFSLTPAIAPGMQPTDLDSHFNPVLDKLHSLNLAYNYTSSAYPTFLSTFNAVSTVSNVSDQNIGGRFIPRSLVENNGTNALVDAIRYISTQAGSLFVGNAISVEGGASSPDDIAANPHFREALISATVGNYIDYMSKSTTSTRIRNITDDLLPKLETLTPGGGAYLSEGDVHQPNFQSTFYGDHYDKLLQIKQQYDPQDIFYAQTAVGSEQWGQNSDGRLCHG